MHDSGLMRVPLFRRSSVYFPAALRRLPDSREVFDCGSNLKLSLGAPFKPAGVDHISLQNLIYQPLSR
jgi:hypothetical protein